MQIFHMFSSPDQPIETRCPNCKTDQSSDNTKAHVECTNCGHTYSVNEGAELKVKETLKEDSEG